MKPGYSAEWLTEEDYKIAAKNGISYDAAYKRFYRYGYSREDAITKPIIPRNKRSARKSAWWDYADTAIVCRETFEKRIKKGMHPAMAAHKEAARIGRGARKGKENEFSTIV
jgi:hypothetical protein